MSAAQACGDLELRNRYVAEPLLGPRDSPARSAPGNSDQIRRKSTGCAPSIPQRLPYSELRPVPSTPGESEAEGASRKRSRNPVGQHGRGESGGRPARKGGRRKGSRASAVPRSAKGLGPESYSGPFRVRGRSGAGPTGTPGRGRARASPSRPARPAAELVTVLVRPGGRSRHRYGGRAWSAGPASTATGPSSTGTAASPPSWPGCGRPQNVDQLLAYYHAIEPVVQFDGSLTYRQVLERSLRALAAVRDLPLAEGDATALADSLPEWPPFPEVTEALTRLRADGWSWPSCPTPTPTSSTPRSPGWASTSTSGWWRPRSGPTSPATATGTSSSGAPGLPRRPRPRGRQPVPRHRAVRRAGDHHRVDQPAGGAQPERRARGRRSCPTSASSPRPWPGWRNAGRRSWDGSDVRDEEEPVELTPKQEELCRQTTWDFSDLRALFINCTLKRSPELSHTQGLADISMEIMRRQGVTVELVRAVDHDIPVGVYPDMTEHGFDRRRVAGHLRAGQGGRHPRAVQLDLAGREDVGVHQGDRAPVRQLPPAQRRRPVRLLRAGRRLPDHRQRGRGQALRHEHPLLPAAPRLRDPAPGRRRAGSARPGPARPTSTPARAARRTTSPTATPRS